MKTLDGRDICEVEDLTDLEEMQFLGYERDVLTGEHIPVWDLPDIEMSLEEIEEILCD